MEYIDKRMALEVIEDALGNLSTPENRGMATGLCGAFYMCGLLNQSEWEMFLVRILEHHRQDSDFIFTGLCCSQWRH